MGRKVDGVTHKNMGEGRIAENFDHTDGYEGGEMDIFDPKVIEKDLFDRPSRMVGEELGRW